MKRIFRILTALLLAAAIPQAIAAREPLSLRVMSLNMKEGGSYADYKAQPYVDFIRQYNPDVVLLQEVDNFTTRNGNKDLLTEIASELGMFPYYAKSFTYQGGAFGVAILSKYPCFKAGRVISSPAGANEPRACGWVCIQLPGGETVRVASVHLAVESEDMRVKNIADYNSELMKDYTTPTLIGGDFNATPDSNTVSYARINWQNLGGTTDFTIPASNPNRRLDYIMGFPKHWTCSNFQVDAQPALSDHCALIADLTYEAE